MIEFQRYPKTPRLFRNVVITEKLDGTNAAVQVVLRAEDTGDDGTVVTVDDVVYSVAAQSRNRLITPQDDNHGFARWVYENAELLARTLGPGLHFGEWWGQGIQRRYGMDYKKFSLFNVARWRGLWFDSPLKELGVVPVLFEGPFSEDVVREMVEHLRTNGSAAAPGFMNPEGVMTFHKAAGATFKTTLVNDEEPKGVNR